MPNRCRSIPSTRTNASGSGAGNPIRRSVQRVLLIGGVALAAAGVALGMTFLNRGGVRHGRRLELGLAVDGRDGSGGQARACTAAG